MVVHCNICAEFVRVFGLFGTYTCYLDYGKLFIVCKKRLKILILIHIASTFALQAESSTGDSLDKYLCVFVWRNLHFAKSFSFLSSSLISFSQIHFIEDKSNVMQERQDFNECYCINVKTLSFPFSATWVTRQKISRDSQLIIQRPSSWRTTNRLTHFPKVKCGWNQSHQTAARAPKLQTWALLEN